jgi:hypothetical protein
LTEPPADKLPVTVRDFAPHTIVFHPGIGKTATSAIQRMGLALPVLDPDRACFSPIGVLGGAHNAFASIHPMFDPEVFERSMAELIAFTLRRNAPTVVSSEFLMRERAEKIQELTAALSSAGIQCQAVFGIREYDGFLMSAYMQALKVGWGMRQNETLEDYAKREISLIRYPELVDRWARCIGDDNVFLIDYDKHRERFLSIFFGFLNLSAASIPEVTETINPSLPIGAAEIVRSFDLACDNEIARRKLIEHLMRLTFRPGIEASLRQCVSQVTGDKYMHDHARLSERYTWLGPERT